MHTEGEGGCRCENRLVPLESLSGLHLFNALVWRSVTIVCDVAERNFFFLWFVVGN